VNLTRHINALESSHSREASGFRHPWKQTYMRSRRGPKQHTLITVWGA
jgi:hypothetical protein